MSYIAKRHENKWIIPKTTCAYCKTEKKRKKNIYEFREEKLKKNEMKMNWNTMMPLNQSRDFFSFVISYL